MHESNPKEPKGSAIGAVYSTMNLQNMRWDKTGESP